ncbi:MAG: preprotein translocase subunit SecG [Patescibacteria group bacterium]
MKTAILLAQIAVSILLIVVILLQAKGSGLSTVFGGEGSFYRSKRGVEKMFVTLTIILAGLFLVLSVASIIA